MPTVVRKRGSRFVAVDKRRPGTALTKPTTKKNAEAFARIRDRSHSSSSSRPRRRGGR